MRGQAVLLLFLVLDSSFASINEAQHFAATAETNWPAVNGNPQAAMDCSAQPTLNEVVRCHLSRRAWHRMAPTHSLLHNTGSGSGSGATVTETAPQHSLLHNSGSGTATQQTASNAVAADTAPQHTSTQQTAPQLTAPQQTAAALQTATPPTAPAPQQAAPPPQQAALQQPIALQQTQSAASCGRNQYINPPAVAVCTDCPADQVPTEDLTSCESRATEAGLPDWILRCYTSLHITLDALAMLLKLYLAVNHMESVQQGHPKAPTNTVQVPNDPLQGTTNTVQGPQDATTSTQNPLQGTTSTTVQNPLQGTTSTTVQNSVQGTTTTVQAKVEDDDVKDPKMLFARNTFVVILLTSIVLVGSLITAPLQSPIPFLVFMCLAILLKIYTHYLLYNQLEAEYNAQHAADPTEATRTFSYKHFFQEEGIITNVLSFFCMLWVLVRLFVTSEAPKADLSLVFMDMFLSQLHAAYLLRFAEAGKGTIHSRVALAAMTGMTTHAIFFPYVMSYRVRSQAQGVAISPAQMKNLHFISDYFGVVTAGIVLATQILEKIRDGEVEGHEEVRLFVALQFEIKMELDTTSCHDDEHAEHSLHAMSATLLNVLTQIDSESRLCAFADDLHGELPFLKGVIVRGKTVLELCAFKDETDKPAVSMKSCNRMRTVLEKLIAALEPEHSLEHVVPVADTNFALFGMVAVAYYRTIYHLLNMSDQMRISSTDFLNNIGAITILEILVGTVLLAVVQTEYFAKHKDGHQKTSQSSLSTSQSSLSSLSSLGTVGTQDPNKGTIV